MFLLCIRHLLDDGLSGQPPHVAVCNNTLLYWICMVVFDRIINIFLYCIIFRMRSLAYILRCTKRHLLRSNDVLFVATKPKANLNWTLLLEFRWNLGVWVLNLVLVGSYPLVLCILMDNFSFQCRFNLIQGHGPTLGGFAVICTGHTTFGRSPLEEWSARHRFLYLTTHNTHNTQHSQHTTLTTHNTHNTQHSQHTTLTTHNTHNTHNTQHSQHTTLTTQNTHIHTPGGIEARNPSKRAAADRRLRPTGSQGRLHLMSRLTIRSWANHVFYSDTKCPLSLAYSNSINLTSVMLLRLVQSDSVLAWPQGLTVQRRIITTCAARFDIQQFYILPTQLYSCVLCGSGNKGRLFPYTAKTHWIL